MNNTVNVPFCFASSGHRCLHRSICCSSVRAFSPRYTTYKMVERFATWSNVVRRTEQVLLLQIDKSMRTCAWRTQRTNIMWNWALEIVLLEVIRCSCRSRSLTQVVFGKHNRWLVWYIWGNPTLYTTLSQARIDSVAYVYIRAGSMSIFQIDVNVDYFRFFFKNSMSVSVSVF
jgi:hypothetical protein